MVLYKGLGIQVKRFKIRSGVGLGRGIGQTDLSGKGLKGVKSSLYVGGFRDTQHTCQTIDANTGSARSKGISLQCLFFKLRIFGCVARGRPNVNPEPPKP